MTWLTLKGTRKTLNERRYKIDWEGKSLSLFQAKVKYFFSEYWSDDLVGEEVKIPNTQLRVDIVNFTRKIAVECNGLFHVQYTPYLQKSHKQFHEQMSRDVLKEHLLELNGFRVIEIYEKNMPLKEEWVLKTFGNILY